MKHFIITRFLSNAFGRTQDEMLSFLNEETLHNGFLMLKNHFIRTLQNQTNRNFEIITLIYDELPLQDVSFLNEFDCGNKIHVLHTKDLNDYIYGFYDNDLLITTRLDYDDFIHKDCVRDVQNSAIDTKYLKIYGLNNGCSMDDDEVCYYHHPGYVGCEHGFFSCFETLIVNTRNYKEPINIYTLGDHTFVCENLVNNLERFGLEDKSQVQIEMDADKKTKYIWYRHDNAVSFIQNNCKHTSDVIVQDVDFEDFGYINKN